MPFFSSKCTSTTRLDGKTAVVTGCNTGIGKETVKDFYRRGARVLMACRTVAKAEEAAAEIKKECESEQNLGIIDIVQLDLTSLDSVRNCAKKLLEEDRIDLLINNAGISLCPYSKTADGFEIQFGTNHLGHFLFTLLLLPKIVQSTPARIVNVSSLGHAGLWGPINLNDLNWEETPYSTWQAYFQSKLANILFTKELARRLQDANIKGVNVYCLHPGTINTELGRHLNETSRILDWVLRTFGKYVFKTPEQGAQTTIYCAVDDKLAEETGLYYDECKVTEPSAKAKNMEDAKKLWDLSLQMVGLDKNYDPFSSNYTKDLSV